LLTSLPKYARDLLGNHICCLKELKVLTSGASSNKNMPVTKYEPEPNIGLRVSAKLYQIPYSFDNTLVAKEVSLEGELDTDLQQVYLRKPNS
jgi:hypothetical protein